MTNALKPNRWANFYPFIFFAATSMLVRSWVPFLHSSWGTLLVGCVLSIIIVPSFLRAKWLWWIVAYSFVILINWWSGDELFDNSSLVMNEIAVLFLFCSAIYYMYTTHDVKCISLTYYVMLVMVGIAAIGSIFVNQIDPSIIRNQSLLADKDEYGILNTYYRMGLSNYLLPHGLPAVIPPLVLLVRRSKEDKPTRIGALLFLVFIIILIYLSGSTTALLLGLVGVFAFLLKENKKNNTRLFVILFILTLPFLLFPQLISEIIGLFSTETSLVYGEHIEDLVGYASDDAQGAQGNSASRVRLYMMSIGEFFKNPIWGTNNPISGHSVLLDRMGALGLLGFIPLMAVYLCFSKFIRRYLGALEQSYFNLSMFLFIVMLLLKGIDDKEVFLSAIIIVPVVLYKCSSFNNTKVA